MAIRTALVSVSDKTSLVPFVRAPDGPRGPHPVERRDGAGSLGRRHPRRDRRELYRLTGGHGRAREDPPPARPRRNPLAGRPGPWRSGPPRRERDRPRRRQLVSVRARRGRSVVVVPRGGREHRHRRSVDGPIGGEKPRPRHHRVRPAGLRPRPRRDRGPRRHDPGDPRRARGQGVCPHRRVRRGEDQPDTCLRATRPGRRDFLDISRCRSSGRTAFATARTRTSKAPSTPGGAHSRRVARARRESLGAGGKELELQQPGGRSTPCARRGPRVRGAGGGRRGQAHTNLCGVATPKPGPVGGVSPGARGGRRERVRRHRRAQPRGRRGDGAGPRRDVRRMRGGAALPRCRSALEFLRAKKNLRLLATGGWLGADHAALVYKRVGGGRSSFRIATRPAPARCCAARW